MSGLKSILYTVYTAAAVLLLLCTFAHGATSNPRLEEAFLQANDAYAGGRYEEAIAAYQDIIDRYGFSPELLHNLGNSYAAAGHNGKAVLHYLRGLRIAPGDDDLQGDLTLVREKSTIFAHDKTPLEQLFGLLDMNHWAFAALFGYVTLTVLTALSIRFPRRKRLLPVCLLLIAVIVVSCFGAYRQRSLWTGGVITQSGTRLLMSPFDSAASLGSIEEGTVVRSEKAHGGYHYILDGGGRSGWVPEGAFEFIDPGRN